MSRPTNTFHAWDYVVFAAVLVISASIGLYYGCTGGRQRTTREFLMADRQMTVFPVALSLLASFMSAVTLLGTPAEIYVFGTQYWMIWMGYVLMIPLAAHVYLPIFYKLQVTSIFEVNIPSCDKFCIYVRMLSYAFDLFPKKIMT